MAAELIFSFSEAGKVSVAYSGESASPSEFMIPLTDDDRDDIRWYVEVYGAQYTTDIDDERAGRIVEKFVVWGRALYDHAFIGEEAAEMFSTFYADCKTDGGLITIEAAAPAVLSLPWELLCADGEHLIHKSPPISVRRRLLRKDEETRRRTSASPAPKKQLHLLFVVSRPTGAGFLDPRADARAVMDALDENAPDRVTVEFLRPPTWKNFIDRLENKGPHEGKPPVDILHFDGHGVFDKKQKTGSLLFENRSGGGHSVTAETFSGTLSEHNISLVLLSACQSAALDEDDPVSGVGAALVHAGVPSVIAMTHSVLAATTRMLFGKFYAGLAEGLGAGSALQKARRFLFDHPERGERRRGEHGRFTLKLYDWFLPSLYQNGDDMPLLIQQPVSLSDDKTSASREKAEGDYGQGRIPNAPIAGFHGRSWELWKIERFFIAGVRRMTVHGFGGQGKTELAVEAGRWLVRSGMFERCCFVDYAAYQGVDPVGMAVSYLAVTLEKSLIDADAAGDALAEVPTLVILDNFESLNADGQTELLDAAVQWSRAGDSRMIITTRQNELDHPAFGEFSKAEHYYLPLEGLAEPDALSLFTALWEEPPDPELPQPEAHELMALFKQVDFYPLSISLLAYQLKTRKVGELGERLESLLADAPGEGADKNLRVSLELSLERLPEEARKWLPRLGVFRGGAMEDVLLEITEIPTWSELSRALETAGLIRAERLHGTSPPFLKFHPALPPALWERLSELEKEDLSARHRAAYYRFSGRQLYPFAQGDNSARYAARHELPNLLFAIKVALNDGDENAVNFINNINNLLGDFGLHRDRDDLNQRAETAVKQGTKAWFTVQVNKGTALNDAGRNVEAESVFRNILKNIGETPTYERARTLRRLGFSLRASGRTNEAAAVYHEGINLTEKLEQSDHMRRLTGVMQADLADTLMLSGDFRGARAKYKASKEIATAIGDGRMEAVANGQLGTLAMQEGDFSKAESLYKEALQIFSRLLEPLSMAAVHHQLGNLYDGTRQWDNAETAYREAVRLREDLGNLSSAADTYYSIANMMKNSGRWAEAEKWYQKAIQAYRETDKVADQATVHHQLGNLYDETRKWDDAEIAYREAVRLWEGLDNLASAADTYYRFANMMKNSDRPMEAEKWYRNAMKAYRATNNVAGQTLTGRSLAVLLQNDTARLHEAQTLAEQALANCKTSTPNEIWRIYIVLALIAKKQGQVGQALQYWWLTSVFRDPKGIPAQITKYLSWIIFILLGGAFFKLLS